MSDLERWQESGLYDPADPGADERRALLAYLTERGATIEQMVEAHARGQLPSVAGTLTLPPVPTATVAEIAARSALPVPLVLRVLVAAGIPAEEDTEVPAEAAGLLDAFKLGVSIMGEDAILAFVRVLGAAATNVAESAIALFFAELGPGSVREGPDELTRAKLSEAATGAFVVVPDVLARMVMTAFERASDRATEARSWQQPIPEGEVEVQGDTEVVALGFVDLVGSTAWGQHLNLRDQNLGLTRFESFAWSSAVLNGGRVVKMIGDEVFFAAPTADAACSIACDVLRSAADDDLLPPARGAVGMGLAIAREGDYFGPLVNLLARLVKIGSPNELVVTEDVAKELATSDWVIEALEPTELRGIEGPVQAFQIRRLSVSTTANGPTITPARDADIE